MSLNPVIVGRLAQVLQAAQAAPRGGKQAIYAAACAELGMSNATLHRHLGKITVKPERKKRSDAGDVSLTRDEAVAISAALAGVGSAVATYFLPVTAIIAGVML